MITLSMRDALGVDITREDSYRTAARPQKVAAASNLDMLRIKTHAAPYKRLPLVDLEKIELSRHLLPADRLTKRAMYTTKSVKRLTIAKQVHDRGCSSRDIGIITSARASTSGPSQPDDASAAARPPSGQCRRRWSRTELWPPLMKALPTRRQFVTCIVNQD